MPTGTQLRYWSMCSYEVASERYYGCVADDEVATDVNGFFTLVLSDPADRPANAAELARAFRRHLSGWRRLWRGVRRRPRLALAGCLALLGAVLSAGALRSPGLRMIGSDTARSARL